MPLQLLPLEEKDAARAVAVEVAAFDPNSVVSRILYPNPPPPEGDSRIKIYQDELKGDTACHGLKVVDTDLVDRGEDGIIAFAIWYIVDAPRSVGPVTHTDLGSVCNPEACQAFFGGMGRKKQEIIGGKPHAYLRVLSTDPAHHRKGAGSMLLKWGMEKADKLGIPCYLESSPAGQPLYEKLGFKAVDKVAADFSKWQGPKFDVPVMIREPVTAAE